MMSVVTELKENGYPQSSLLPQNPDCRPSKSTMYKCVGIAVFVAAFVPANIVAWIYLFNGEGKGDVSMSISSKNSSLENRNYEEQQNLSNHTQVRY